MFWISMWNRDAAKVECFMVDSEFDDKIVNAEAKGYIVLSKMQVKNLR